MNRRCFLTLPAALMSPPPLRTVSLEEAARMLFCSVEDIHAARRAFRRLAVSMRTSMRVRDLIHSK